jgi:hypothetical protein
MSLAIGTPEPRHRAAPKKVAAKKPAPRRVASTAKTATRPPAASTVDAERLFRRFEQLLPEGDHQFPALRQDFSEWCEAGDVTPPSANQLAALLRQAGLSSSRRGRAKVTVYSKHAARLAA